MNQGIRSRQHSGLLPRSRVYESQKGDNSSTPSWTGTGSTPSSLTQRASADARFPLALSLIRMIHGRRTATTASGASIMYQRNGMDRRSRGSVISSDKRLHGITSIVLSLNSLGFPCFVIQSLTYACAWDRVLCCWGVMTEYMIGSG